jgi:hypothetical protein
MKLEYRYYVANRTEDGLLKIAHEETGPYYNTSILISRYGYETRALAYEAVVRYVEHYGSVYTFTILEEMTATKEDKNE